MSQSAPSERDPTPTHPGGEAGGHGGRPVVHYAVGSLGVIERGGPGLRRAGLSKVVEEGDQVGVPGRGLPRYAEGRQSERQNDETPEAAGEPPLHHAS